MTRDEWRGRGPVVDKLPKKQLPPDLVDETKLSLETDTAALISSFSRAREGSNETRMKAREVAKKIDPYVE